LERWILIIIVDNFATTGEEVAGVQELQELQNERPRRPASEVAAVVVFQNYHRALSPF